jgi:hypothetical protein
MHFGIATHFHALSPLRMSGMETTWRGQNGLETCPDPAVGPRAPRAIGSISGIANRGTTFVDGGDGIG